VLIPPLFAWPRLAVSLHVIELWGNNLRLPVAHDCVACWLWLIAEFAVFEPPVVVAPVPLPVAPIAVPAPVAV
jgi:hypothetical protein